MKKFVWNSKISIQGWVLLVLSGTLLYVFTLPHAMALRKLLMTAAFLISASQFLIIFRQKQNELIFLLAIYALLQAWMLGVALFIADQPIPSLLEWKGQWLTTSLSLVIGIGLATMLMKARLHNPLTVIVLVVAIPTALLAATKSVLALREIWHWGTFLAHRPGILNQPADIGYAIALLVPLLVADGMCRIMNRTPLLPISNWGSGIVLGMTIFALVTAASRNGLINMLLAFILGGVVILSKLQKTYPRKKIAVAFLIGAIFIIGYMGIALKSDPRWQSFAETIPIAWDIDRDTNWLYSDGTNAPLTSSGKPVDVSAYNRIAWAHEAWRMFLAHPWGTEIARDTFHKLELAKYGHAGMAHSHNGWLDFGLNVGIPGLILWATFLFLLARAGWRAWQRYGDPLGFALVLLVVMFAFRALLDSIFRNHMIEQFMLVAGLLIGALTFNKKPPPQHDQKQ